MDTELKQMLAQALDEIKLLRQEVADVTAIFKPNVTDKMSAKEKRKLREEKDMAEFIAGMMIKP